MSEGPDAAPRAVALPADAVRSALKRQYGAAIAMLRDAVERCPDDLWFDERPTNRSWQVAYHALFFAHFYLGRDEHAFVPWSRHQGDVQYPDGIPGPADPASPLPLCATPYSRADVLAYADFCAERVDREVDALDLAAETCGFPWYPIPKLDHQIVNIRHIQHHAAQLADRVRAAADVGVRWVGSR